MSGQIRERIAILGGGPAALSTAFYLTSTPELRERYDITLYQMGFRLGGKTVSGRGAFGRVEEHGLHILFGCYESLFALMRECYEELGEREPHPFPGWDDAVEPAHFGVVGNLTGEAFEPFFMHFPRASGIPGDGSVLPSSADYVKMLVQLVLSVASGGELSSRVATLVGWGPVKPSEMSSAASTIRLDPAMRLVLRALRRVLSPKASGSVRERALTLARSGLWKSLGARVRVDPLLKRVVLGVDWALTCLIGIHRDGLLEPSGLRGIDDYDYREWLERHGAHAATVNSYFGWGIYDAAFSYENGEPERRRVAAGAALYAVLRLLFTYKGSIYYKMRAGMGDVVVAPLYRVLRRRGVRFEFFHKVEALELNETHESIAAVRLTRQAKLKHGKEYEPLVEVNRLACWPSAPLHEQLEAGDELRDVDFESYYSEHRGVGSVRLVAGRDFDRIVFGIPIGAVPFVCGELLRVSSRWRSMVEHVQSVQTLALQIWTKKSAEELGWRHPPALLSLYHPPLNTWCEMTQLLKVEAWPSELGIQHVSYFTGPQPGPKRAPPLHERDFPAQQLREARSSALDFLERRLKQLLPGVERSDGSFDWDVLVDHEGRSGPERLNAQYVRSNCEPSERCTLALPGSARFRMKAGDTGFNNLVVTGDWTDNGIYLACVEGAVASGVFAARAIFGHSVQTPTESLRAHLTPRPRSNRAPAL